MSAPIDFFPHYFQARAHAKVNLHLGVGPARGDGFHELATVFQSLALADVVSMEATAGFSSDPDQPLIARAIEVTGPHALGVPTGPENLVRAAVEKVRQAMVARFGHQLAGRERTTLPLIYVAIEKNIPAAGGMAGGSADAAAALLLADAILAPFFEAETLGEDVLYDLAAQLGSDVPFTLMGGTALGTGRGEVLTPMMARGQFHWAIVTSDRGLSTPEVFAKIDQLRAQAVGGDGARDAAHASGTAAAGLDALAPSLDTTAVSRALISGDATALAAAMANDLSPAALSLRPDLRATLAAGQAAGALAGIVSGSGPTCAFLCADSATAAEVAAEVELEIPGTRALTTTSPASGARITSVS